MIAKLLLHILDQDTDSIGHCPELVEFEVKFSYQLTTLMTCNRYR